MRYGRVQVHLWAPLSTGLDRPPPADPSSPRQRGGAEVLKAAALSALQHAGEVGRLWGQRSAQAASATVSYWWERYEEFVGLNEVREAQTKVTEAEAAFMIARGMVREAHNSLEALQGRLKEVRDRLDRVSREEARYLELATQEHRLLQEERRFRTAYENAEGSEREKFGEFSAAVRGSHEKERARAERTKNWSVIGSVLGAVIGVMGSTYVNRVRLQELKNLLLEAQKGPESLQEALKVQAGNHRSQQDELRTLIDSLRAAVTSGPQETGRPAPPPPPPAAAAAASPSAFKDLQAGSQRTESLVEALPPQLERLERGLGRVEGDLATVRRQLETRPDQFQGPERGDHWETGTLVGSLQEAQRTLGEGIRTNTVYNAVFTYTAAAITVSAVYLLLRGTG